jgi:hypothetical protein
MKFFYYFFLGITLSGCGLFGGKKYHLVDDDWRRFSGTIYLANGDTLKGIISLYSSTYARPKFIGLYEENLRSKSRIIECDEIKWLKISSEGGSYKHFTEFHNLHYKTSLWRLVRQKRNVSLYDDIRNPHTPIEKYIPRNLILVKDNKIERIITATGSVLRDNRTRPILKRFINKRYNKHFKKRDFRDGEEMIEYILKNG